MLPAMPTAHTRPRLDIPALFDIPSEPKPVIAVAPQSSKARPTERWARRRSPPSRRNASCMKML